MSKGCERYKNTHEYQFERSSNPKETHIIRRHEPGHLGAGRELTVYQALDLTLGPAVVDVHDRDHVPLARLELVLDAVLEALALDLHRRQHQAVADEVRRVADALGRFEAVAGVKTF